MSDNPKPDPGQPDPNQQLPVQDSAVPPVFSDIPQDAKTMAMLAHLLGAIFALLGSLIIWLIKKDDHPFIDDQGKEATNFQITLFIAYLVTSALMVASCGFLFFLPLIPYILQLVFGIMGALKAKDGIAYRYPINIRFIK